MVLDFNSQKCKFKLNDLTDYNVDTIFENIDKFKRFINETVLSNDFEKVFRTTGFQVATLDPSTAYVDILLTLYNSIAEMLSTPVSHITEKQLMHELRARGYNIKRTTRRNYIGVREKAYKVWMEERYERNAIPEENFKFFKK